MMNFFNLFVYEIVQNAFLAGTIVAIVTTIVTHQQRFLDELLTLVHTRADVSGGRRHESEGVGPDSAYASSRRRLALRSSVRRGRLTDGRVTRRRRTPPARGAQRRLRSQRQARSVEAAAHHRARSGADRAERRAANA